MSAEQRFTLDDIRPRAGFETRPIKKAGERRASGPNFYRTYLTETIASLKKIFSAIDSEHSDRDVKIMIANFLTEYCDLAPLETEGKKLECYEQFSRHIGRAQAGDANYLDTMLVHDLTQRMEHQQEIVTTSDPIELFDMLRTVPNQRARFEIRQLLHAGAMLYEYERVFGTERELKQLLHDFWIYIDAVLFPTLQLEDGNLYHRVEQNRIGGMSATGIRAPRFEKKSSRQHGENLVPVTYRNALLPDTSTAHVLVRGRVKSPFSALLKTIEKGVSIADTRDVLGVTFFVDHRSHELYALADKLLHALQRDGITMSEYEPHLLRRDPETPLTPDENTGRSRMFRNEKFVIDWHPSFSLLQRNSIDAVLARLYSSPRNRNAFWERAQQERDMYIPIEIQIGTLVDAVNTTMEGDSLHSIYKAGKASSIFKGTSGMNVLEVLRPKKYFGIDFIDGPAPKAIRRKQEASIGLHRQILDQLEEAEKNKDAGEKH